MRRYFVALALLAFLHLGKAAEAQQAVFSCVENIGHTGAACELTPSGVSTASENGHVIKASGGVLVGFQVNNWTTANGLTVMLLDATAVPSNSTLAICSYTNGTANASPCIMKWYGVDAAPSASEPRSLGVSWSPGPPLHFTNGLVIVCSSTGPVTLTLSANCTFSAEIE